MSDFTQEILSRINEHRTGNLGLEDDFVQPFYNGLSLVNIPGTVTRLLDAGDFGRQPLDDALLSQLGGPYQKVIVLLVDALGYTLLERMMTEQGKGFWARQREKALFVPITSVCPSTTATALTTLWTGQPPAAHGIVGYEMWAREFNMIINNILHTPAAYHGDVGGLSRTGFNPSEFLPSSRLGSHLVANGVQATTFIHRSIAHSGLSEMQMDDVQVQTYVDEADLWVSLAEHMNRNPLRPEYIYVYYSDVDTLMHRFNDEDLRVGLQFSAFSWVMEEGFIRHLSPKAAQSALMILTADHGSMATPQNMRYDLNEHPKLLDCLVMQPTCENRLSFFYTKPGRKEDLRAYIENIWQDEFTLLDSEQALAQGLFGSEPHHPGIRARLGDLIAVAKGNAYFWWAPKLNHMRGRHGGLSPEEMLVPFYALPLRELVNG
jgi:hypothetical protein